MAFEIYRALDDNLRLQITTHLRDLQSQITALSALVSDTAYDATSWNGVTTIAPSKNAVRDKIESLAASIPTVSDTAYGSGWNGDTTVAPSKNAVYDKIEAVIADYVPDTGDTTIAGVKTFSSDPLIPDEAYGSGWNGVLEPPTKNAVYDKIEAVVAGIAGWTTIVKSANQDVTNSGEANDTELQFAVTANSHYMVEMILTTSGNDTTGDWAFKFVTAAGTMTGTGFATAWASSAGLTPTGIRAAAASSSSPVGGGVFVSAALTASLDDISTVTIYYSFVPSNTTTFHFRFGNGTPAVGRTSRTWKGSIMRYKTLD